MESAASDLAQENSILKNALCVKDHEIYILRSELERRSNEVQNLLYAMDRMEKTIATCYDRLLRKLEHFGVIPTVDTGGRKRRY